MVEDCPPATRSVIKQQLIQKAGCGLQRLYDGDSSTPGRWGGKSYGDRIHRGRMPCAGKDFG